METWLPVFEFERYEVNRAGQVRNRETLQVLKPCPLREGGYCVYSLHPVPGTQLTRLAHIVVYSSFYGKPPKGLEIDHIDRNKSNNSLENLRLLDRSTNQARAVYVTNKSTGYRGVSRQPYNRYRAGIKKANVQIHLGYFSTPENAARAYNTKALEIYGEFAVLNEIP